MGSLTEISVLYREFTDALAEILAENVVGPARRGRLARARAIVKRHPQYSEHEVFSRRRSGFRKVGSDAGREIGRSCERRPDVWVIDLVD